MTRAFNIDCMIGMKDYPDKYFELAIVDPPYGISIYKKSKGFSSHQWNKDNTFFDDKPNAEYFEELFRISQNQIIWGANYFIEHLANTNCMLFWNKWNNNKGKFADGEFAWTSFSSPSQLLTIPWLRWYQMDMKFKEIRVHPTQKPIILYLELLRSYAKPGDKILDTHLGSGSSRIAAYQMGFDFTGFELNKDYFDASVKRFEQYKSQLTIFQP